MMKRVEFTVGTEVSWEDIWNGSACKDIPLPEELRSLEQAFFSFSEQLKN